MDLHGSITCFGCLNKDRKMKLIKDFWTKKCFSEIVNEIPSLNGLPIWMCWECAALLSKFTKFKHQVVQSYKALQDYKSGITFSSLTQRLQIEKIVSIAIFPEEENSSTEDLKAEDGVKMENSLDIHQPPDVSVKEEDISNDEEDRALIELVETKKRGRRKETRKKRENQRVNVKTEFYTEVRLTATQVQEERRVMLSSEEYANAMFRCERCILSFPNADDLKDHDKLKHDLNAPFTCATCERSFATEVSFKYHRVRHSRRYQCVACGARAASERAAARHYQTVHCGGNNIMLKEEISKRTDQMKGEIADQEARFPCEQCAKTFRWKTSLRKHAEKHRIENGQKRKPYCEPCKLTFTTTSNLQKHVKTSSKHQIQLQLRKLNESQPTEAETELARARERQVRSAVNGERAQHACAHCGARYQWRGNLLRHLHTHTARAKGELVCKPCNRTFSSIATYQQHMKISKKHVSENDFKFMCSDCGKKFANKTRLKDHVNWEHLKNFVHTCQICQKVFKSHTSLYLHGQVVHRKDHTEHLCDHCGKPFPNQAKLRSHITALHSGEAPYKCSSCTARFSWHSCLSRHIRRVHRKRHAP